MSKVIEMVRGARIMGSKAWSLSQLKRLIQGSVSFKTKMRQSMTWKLSVPLASL